MNELRSLAFSPSATIAFRSRPARVPACHCAGACRCGGLVPALLLIEIERECEFFRNVL